MVQSVVCHPVSSPTPAVPLCDLARQTAGLEHELLTAVARVLRSGRFVLGPESDAFCAELAGLVGTRFAVGVASGTDALVLALRAAGLRPGGAVLTTPFSFFATAEAIVLAGGSPVFCDIDPVTYNLDVAQVTAVLDGKSTVHRRLGLHPSTIQAILPVHLFGHPAEVTALKQVADAAGLILVEDAAQALGSTENGRRVGTIGHAGCVSFFPSKNVGGFGDGGAVLTDDPDVADAVVSLRAHGATTPHQHERIGVNSRLDEIQAALLRVKLPHLDGWITQRRKHAAAYRAGLSGLPDLTTPTDRSHGGHSFAQYTVRVTAGRRNSLQRHLAADGIASAIYYPRPLHLQKALRHLGYRAGDFPIAESTAAEVLSLPMFPELTRTEVDRVIASVRRALT